MDYANEYHSLLAIHLDMVARSNHQNEMINILQAKLVEVSEGFSIIEKRLAGANSAENAPFPLVGDQSDIWCQATTSAYQHSLEMCNSEAIQQFISNGFMDEIHKASKTTVNLESDQSSYDLTVTSHLD